MIKDPHDMELELKINGKVRQRDNTGNMLFKINEQMEWIEESGTALREGDLLMTGTPEGMAPVAPGDLIEATLSTPGPNGKVISEITKNVLHEQRL